MKTGKEFAEDRCKLEGFQKKYLRGLAHGMKPVVLIGQRGVTDSVVKAIGGSLNAHELIKVKFIEIKEKAKKIELLTTIEEKTKSEAVGMIGHTAILYRGHKDPEKRRIVLPER